MHEDDDFICPFILNYIPNYNVVVLVIASNQINHSDAFPSLLSPLLLPSPLVVF
jgi:hypothetical protein